VRANHPDKLIAEGMPEEFIKVATDKLAKINAAYDSIARQRGLG
jgi:DnaJ like chaperone protein